MWREPDDFAELTGLRREEGPRPASADAGEVGRREEADGGNTFTAIGALAGAIVDRLKLDRAARTAPRVPPVAPEAGVAAESLRRPYRE